MTLVRVPPQCATNQPAGYPKPLPVGTHVKRNIGGHTGTVQPYLDVIPRMGTFPVAWDSRVTGCRIWEIVSATDVEIVAEAPAIPPRRAKPSKKWRRPA